MTLASVAKGRHIVDEVRIDQSLGVPLMHHSQEVQRLILQWSILHGTILLIEGLLRCGAAAIVRHAIACAEVVAVGNTGAGQPQRCTVIAFEYP